MAATIERVMELQGQGMSDSDIIKKLRDEGLSPKDINDSLNQAKIKSAVSTPETNEMEQSIMQAPDVQEAPPAEQQAQQFYPEQPQYQTYDQSYAQPTIDTQTISEVAEQVFSDKFKEFEEKTGDLVSFKNSVQDSITDLDERLKRIESSIDKLQQAVIGKIGEYGENMSFVHKDLTNIHDTMSKMMNPLVDNFQALKKLAGNK